MKIRLHSFIDISLKIEIHTTKRNRIEPIEIDAYSNRTKKAKLVTDEIKKFAALEILIEDDLVAYEVNFTDFIELLNCFVSNLLDIEHEYNLSYRNGKGYVSKIVSKDKKVYLQIITIQTNEKIFLSKYDCKIITSNFQKIYSKCTRQEFL